MWPMRVIILLLFCYACLSANNGGVRFVSKNFNNVLQWDPAEPASENTSYTYSVQYWSDDDEQPFKKKKACQNTTALFCDLTGKTPSLPDVHYVAEVLVNDRFHGKIEKRFKPIADTSLGPPILSNRTTATSLLVNATLPLGPKGVPIADIIARSKMRPSEDAVVYFLKITKPEWAAHDYKTTGNQTGQFVINLKNNQTQYCGYVVYEPNCHAKGLQESEKAFFCVKLQGDPPKHLPWLLLCAALLVVLVIMSGVCVCKYVKAGNKSMPKHLVPTSSPLPPVLEFVDGNLSISRLVVCHKTTADPKIPERPNVPPVGVGGYSPQDFLACQGSTPCTFSSSVGTGAHSLTPNSEATSSQSSEIYSVVAVQVPLEEQVTAQNPLLSSSGESWDEGLKLIPRGVPPLPDPDPRDSDQVGPLVLRTVRDNNGKLVLSSLTLQLQSHTGDTETKPLISDPIHSTREGPSLASLFISDCSECDSGCDSTLNTPTHPYCNTHYFLSQPVDPNFHQGSQNTLLSNDASSESGYKQNWMPAILVNPSSSGYRGTHFPQTWIGLKEEEEGEEEEDRRGEEGPGKTLLGGWMVQVQE